MTGHYLPPAPAGECEIGVTTIRTGRRLATASATLSMGAKPTLTLLATFGDQSPGGPSRQMSGPVELPPFDQSAPAPPAGEGPKPELMNRIDIRMDPRFRHPVRCAFCSRFIHDGLLDEEGEIWDSTGTLVCQSRQLALTPRRFWLARFSLRPRLLLDRLRRRAERGSECSGRWVASRRWMGGFLTSQEA